MKTLFQTLVPPEKISTKDWVNKYRRISAKSSARPGKFNTATTPYIEEILDVLDDPAVSMVVCMKSAQVGWTDGVVNNYIARRIDVDPCPIIMMFPKEGAAKEYEKEKFRPMVEVTERIRDRVDLRRGRADGNSNLFKEFPGGFLKLVGSNSASSVKSTPAPVVIIEEPDDTNADVKGQGNTIKLLMERTKSFYRRKILYGGTPTIKGVSEVEAAYNRSDQRKLFVPCHECGASHVLDFAYLLCDDDPDFSHPVYGHKRPETAYYVCPDCGVQWNDNDRIRNIRSAKWCATSESDTPGFFINELYSPFPGSCHKELVKKRLEAEHKAENGDFGDLIAFTNSSEGKPYEFKSDLPETAELQDRALNYQEKSVPHGGLIITVGVDVQHDRLAVIIRAWGRGEESWLIYWGELPAAVSTTDKNDPVWSELDQLIFSVYPSLKGFPIRVSAASIDSGDGNTNDAVYHYVRSRKGRGVRVMAIKGDQMLEKEIVSTPKKVDLNNNTKASRFGLQVFMVGTNRAKDLFSNRLKLTGLGAGRIHYYKTVRSDYFEQITSEVKAPHRTLRGKLAWQKRSGIRNEALDCEVYALHASRVLRVHLKKGAEWDAIESELMQCDLLSPDKPSTEGVSTSANTQSAENERSPSELSMEALGRMLGHGN